MNFATEFSTVGSGSGDSGSSTTIAIPSSPISASSHRNDIATALAALRDRAKETNDDDNDTRNQLQSTTVHWFRRLCRRLSRVGGRSRGRLTDLSFSALRQFIAFKIGVIVTTVFLFFTTTTLVSFTLRETQERMLKFTFMLQHHISHR